MKPLLIALTAAAALAACANTPPGCRGEVFALNPGRATVAAASPTLPTVATPPREAAR